MQWSADATKHAHVQEIKNPAQMGNNQNYYNQIARHLDRSDKCFRFNLATYFETQETRSTTLPEDIDDFDQEDKEDVDINDVLSTTQCLQVSHSTVDYFSIADSLMHGCIPNAPKPYCTFATSSTAFHITTKSSLRLTVKEAAIKFGIVDLRPAINDFLQHLQNNSGYPVTSIQTHDSNCPLPFKRVQIWYKVHVQQFLYHDRGKVDVPQTLKALPPSTQHPHGLYDTVIMSPDSQSDWPLWGIEGMFSPSRIANHRELISP